MTASQYDEAREKLRQWIAEQDKIRGRPLTNAEKLANLKAALEHCDQCGGKVELAWRFCPRCGYDLMGDEDGAPGQ